jgi:serine/threonine protein kinase
VTLKVDDSIEKYIVEAEIGVGAMATVYRVRHTQLGSLHALKVLHVNNDSVKQRTIQEGQVQSGLRHPNIVTVTDIVDVNGSPGLVMELVEGPTLDSWLQNHRPSMEDAEALFHGILNGMERAHAHRLIHRDLKPANILLAPVDGRWVPKIADFGLAKAQGKSLDLKRTQAGVMMGTPAYMAPEQIKDASAVDHRADIFSLGCLLYELMVGQVPFHDEDWIEVLHRIRKGDYQPPEEVNPLLPPRICAAIRSCLVVDVNGRVGTVSGLRSILLEEGEGTMAGPVATSPTSPLVSLPGAPTLMKESPVGPSRDDHAVLVPPAPISDSQAIVRGLVRGLGAGGVILLVAFAIIFWMDTQRQKLRMQPPAEPPVAEAPKAGITPPTPETLLTPPGPPPAAGSAGTTGTTPPAGGSTGSKGPRSGSGTVKNGSTTPVAPPQPPPEVVVPPPLEPPMGFIGWANADRPDSFSIRDSKGNKVNFGKVPEGKYIFTYSYAGNATELPVTVIADKTSTIVCNDLSICKLKK